MTKKANGEEGGYATWPKLGVAARPATKEALHKLAEHLGVPEWRAVEIALLAYIDGLPEKERKTMGIVKPNLVRIELPADHAAAVRSFLRLWSKPKGELETATRVVIADALDVSVPE